MVDVMEIQVERQPAQERLEELGVGNWPIWTKAISQFRWTYDSPETCYFLAGDVIVTPDGGEAVRVGTGDLVTFPAGMSCTWDIRSGVKKHYKFS
ncbi:putative enzyme of the cupin superfamily [Rubidibacter lacunae KORDI 51-2]|uniref:Putative enzyme of the cupin superfamily n=1 Tax=Rubidibacter lacunae KORDI 51-2 TaxID=582515 RepID=U5DN60_9CHRO|nr:cupin domain-containing protein [Rubidibacter lacunae]ERN41115.1 putative enzyme of the cupin superfamily [Rubidibacter lacunae KORDI 51-2]